MLGMQINPMQIKISVLIIIGFNGLTPNLNIKLQFTSKKIVMRLN